ncbi:MAG: TIGR00730 family Rossman fold protein [Bacteroidia bacterium]
MKNVCVYCGANSGFDPAYAEAGKAFARELAQRGHGLVYGAGNVGMMGIIADEALAHGAHVLGVIPTFLKEKEVCHTGIQEVVVTETMHERKAIMEVRSDAFVALPGGFGTLDELCEILTWAQLGLHQKPIALLNVNGYFDPLLALADHMMQEGFLKKENRNLLIEATEVPALFDMLEQYDPPAPTGKWLDRQLT